MEPHRHHPETGEVILEEAEPPEHAEARAMEHAAEAAAAAEVEKARIEADAAVQLAKIERSALDDEERVELEALREEVAALRAMNAPPEPEPIVIDAPPAAEPEPVEEDAPPVEEHHDEAKPSKPRGMGMW